MHLIFMGTPAFALPTLRAIHEAGHSIAAVYTQPPRPAGRGQKETPSPVHQYALAHGLPVHTPESLKNETLPPADAAVVAAYGLLLPRHILESPEYGCLNVHPSLLPRWRGAAPIQRALMAGDAETGVCIMRMDEGLDTGDVLRCERFAIPPEMDAGGLHDALAELGARMMVETLADLPNIAATRQSDEGITYAKKITKADCRIDWNRPAEEIVNQIRGLSPSPGAFFEAGGEAIKVFSAIHEPHAANHALPGTVLDDRLTVACGNNTALRLLEIQRPGKKRMKAEEALKGWSVAKEMVVN